MNDLANKIRKWIIEEIEAPHEFYDYRFPVCPFARSARLSEEVDIVVYASGGPYKFIKQQVQYLQTDKIFKIKIMAFPKRMRWYLHLHFLLDRMNCDIVGKDLYIQYGKNDDAFIVIVNRLSSVLDGHRSLLKTDYYKNWSKDHYDAVVERRQKIYKKYK
jgi:hypothetical protein